MWPRLVDTDTKGCRNRVWGRLLRMDIHTPQLALGLLYLNSFQVQCGGQPGW